MTGIKFEKVGQAMSIATLKVDLVQWKHSNEAFTIKAEELCFFNGAFESRTKAFMKLG